MDYPKINTLFKRDSQGIIIPSEFTTDEFDYLKDVPWECTEKIDGTNIVVTITMEAGEGENPWLYGVSFKGRTDRAVIPKHLEKKLHDIFIKADWAKIFPTMSPEDTVYLFGEGYGTKIQTVGNRYIKDDVNFILFDVLYNDLWLTRDNCEDIARKCSIDIVPLIGYYTIQEAIDYVIKGFKSTIAEDKELDAEGLVLKTPVGLKDRRGNRIITKVKRKDFLQYNRVNNKVYNINNN